jgi:hypothetical protein
MWLKKLVQTQHVYILFFRIDFCFENTIYPVSGIYKVQAQCLQIVTVRIS